MLSRLRVLNPFRLPRPKELGRSEHDFLESRDFDPFTKGYTWEDWEAEVRAKHPVRWFFSEAVPRWLRRSVLAPAVRVKDWVTFSLFRRYHLLDIRTADYRRGYLDPCEQLRLACWACLVSYVEECEPRDPADWATPEDLKDPAIAAQKAQHDELMALYGWWKHGRLQEEREETEAFALVKRSEAFGRQTYEAMSRAWSDVRRANEEAAERRLVRLVELRHHLWT